MLEVGFIHPQVHTLVSHFKLEVLKPEVFSLLTSNFSFGGDERARTAGLLRARQALSQLSYIPLTGGRSLEVRGWKTFTL